MSRPVYARGDDAAVRQHLSLHEPQNWPALLSASQVAHLLVVERHTIQAMIQRGELPATRVGKQWRIAPEDVWPFIPAVVRSRWPEGPWRAGLDA